MAGAGAHVGNAWVSVQPETKGFYKDLERQLKERFAGKKPKVKLDPEIDKDRWQSEIDKQAGEDMKVRLKPDTDNLKRDLRGDLKDYKVTVGARLSTADKAAVQAELKHLADDQHATIHVRTDTSEATESLKVIDKLIKGLNVGDDGRARLDLSFNARGVQEDLDATLDQIKFKPIELDFDESQVDKLVDKLDRTFSADDGSPAFSYVVPVEVDDSDMSKLEKRLKDHESTHTAKVRVTYANSQEKGSTKLQRMLEDLDKPKRVKVDVDADTTNLDAALDVMGKKVTVRPELSKYHTQKVEDQLDKLTRPRMVEVTTGDTHLSNFQDDLAQAFQNAWEDMDVELDPKDVFGTKARQLDDGHDTTKPTNVRVVNDNLADLKLPKIDWDEMKPVKVDFPEVQKVYVVNQQKGTGVAPTSVTSPADHNRDVAKVDLADVSTSKPLNATVDNSRTRVAGDKPDTTAVPAGTWADIADAVDAARDAATKRSYMGDRQQVLEKELRQLTEEAKRYLAKADAYEARNKNVEDYRNQVLGHLDNLAGQYKQWAPNDAYHLRRMLTENPGIGGGRTIGKIDTLDTEQARIKATADFNQALANNARLHADFLNQQANDRQSRSGLHSDHTRVGAPGIADSIDYEYNRLSGGGDVEKQIVAKADKLNESMDAMEKSLAKATSELVSTKDHLTPFERALREFNVEGYANDPDWKQVSADEFRVMKNWRPQDPAPTVVHKHDDDHHHSDSDRDVDFDAPDFFEKVVNRLVKPNRRDGTASYMAKNIAGDLMRPVGKAADKTVDLAGKAFLKTSDAVTDGATKATEVTSKSVDAAKGALDGVMDLKDSVEGTVSSASSAPGADMLGGGGKGGGALKGLKGNPATAIGGKAVGTLASGYGIAAKLGAVGALAGGAGNLAAGSLGMATAVLEPFVQALQSVAFAPAMLSALAASAGTVALAFSNLGDESADLGPNAIAMKEGFAGLAESLDPIRKATQESLFAGWDESFAKLTDSTMPALERSLPRVAEGLGDITTAFMDTLASPTVTSNIERTLGAVGDGFSRMAPGMESLTDFFARASAVGAEHLMPALGDGFSNLMDSLNSWGSEEKLGEWMDNAVGGLRKIGDFSKTAWSGMSGFFGAVKDGANAAFGEGGVWGAMMGQLDKFSNWANSSEGQAKISSFFRETAETTKDIGATLGEWGEKFVTETIPQFQSFWRQNGEDITNIGNDLISGASDAMSTLTPIIKSIEPVVAGFSKAMDKANEIVGGPGSKKDLKDLSDYTDGANTTEKRIKGYKDDKSLWGGDGPSAAWTVGTDENLKAQEETLDRIINLKQKLNDQARYGNQYTPEFGEALTQMNQMQVMFESLRGGFDGVKQSGDATAAVFSALGDAIVDVPDDKTIVVESEGLEDTLSGFQELEGINVEDIGDGLSKISFDSILNLEGAIDVLKAKKDEIGEVNFEAQGLDTVLAQLEGMQDKIVTVNVEGVGADEIVSKLDAIQIKAENIDGEVKIDLNDEDTLARLEEIDAIARDPKTGEITFNDNIDEILAEKAGLEGLELTGNFRMEDNVDEVKGKADSLEGKQTEGKHHVDDDADQARSNHDSLSGKQTQGNHHVDDDSDVARSRHDSLSGKQTQGNHHVDSDVDQAAGKQDSLNGKTTQGRHNVTSNVDEARGKHDSLSGKTTQGKHRIADNASEVKAKIDAIPKSTSGRHTITSNAGTVIGQVQSLNGMNTSSTHTITTVRVGGGGKANADGAVMARAYESGGFEKRQAMVAKGGSNILWAENETEDESYIPHNPAKRKRSTQILRYTAEKFGLQLLDGNGNPINKDGTHLGHTGKTVAFANGGVSRSEYLRDLNRERATREAYEKVEQRRRDQEAGYRKAKSKSEKEKTPADKNLIAEYEATKKRGEELQKQMTEGYARKLVGVKDGKFIYADTDTDDKNAVRSVDRAGLIDTNVGMREYMERGDASHQSMLMLRAMENENAPMTPEQQRVYDSMPKWAQDEYMRRRRLPANVQKALLTGEKLEDPDAPIDLKKVLESQQWVKAASHIAANPKDQKSWIEAGGMVKGQGMALHRAVSDEYTKQGAKMIGLKVTKPSDSPLYNLFNPSTASYNQLIADVNKGRRELEGDYQDKYRDERDIMREAQDAERQRQQADEDAKRKAELYGDAERLRKEIDSQNERNAQEQARYDAGVSALREHRAATAQSTTTTSGGVTVNQSIASIVTNNATDAADRFRRQATVGFENLVGSI